MIKNFSIKTFLSLIFCILLSCVVFANHTEEVRQNIIRQAKEQGVEPAIVLSIAKTESGFNQKAKSASGHIGVFQLSPRTAKTMGLDPYDMDDNIKGGIIYYKNMYDKLGSMELAVAAYNCGYEAIKRANYTVPSYSRHFVHKIMTDYNHYKKQEL